MQRNSRERFERELRRAGAGRAPNGADYKLVQADPFGPVSVERVYQGRRETIVAGYNGERFVSLEHAHGWARADGRYEMRRGESICCRPLVAEGA